MPRQMWCCDYCNYQDESESYVIEHEEKFCANAPEPEEDELDIDIPYNDED